MTTIQKRIEILGTMSVKELENEALSASRAAFDNDGKVNDWKLVLAQDRMAAEVSRAEIVGLASRSSEASNADARKAHTDDLLAKDPTYQKALLKIAETENEIAGFEAAASSWRREFQGRVYAVRARTAMIEFMGAADVMTEEGGS